MLREAVLVSDMVMAEAGMVMMPEVVKIPEAVMLVMAIIVVAEAIIMVVAEAIIMVVAKANIAGLNVREPIVVIRISWFYYRLRLE